MFTVYSLYVHYMFTVCQLYVQCIFTICSLYVHFLGHLVEEKGMPNELCLPVQTTLINIQGVSKTFPLLNRNSFRNLGAKCSV